jgi:hypothetical protein
MNIGPSFASGYHSIEKLPAKDIQKISDQFKKLTADIVADPTADLDFTITSGESQVTNKDAEAGNKELNPKELGDMRSTSAEEFIDDFMKGLKEKGIFKGNYKIKIAPTVVGTTPYKRGISKASDTSFTKEQFVTIDVEAKDTPAPNKTYVKASATDTEPIYAPGEGSKVNPAIAEIWYTTRVAVDNESGTVNYNPGDLYAIRFLKDFKDWGKDDQGNKIRSVNGDINQKVYEPGIYYIKKGDWMKIGGSAKNMPREKLQSLIDQSGVPASVTNN